jgi:hypothetical protein
VLDRTSRRSSHQRIKCSGSFAGSKNHAPAAPGVKPIRWQASQSTPDLHPTPDCSACPSPSRCGYVRTTLPSFQVITAVRVCLAIARLLPCTDQCCGGLAQIGILGGFYRARLQGVSPPIEHGRVVTGVVEQHPAIHQRCIQLPQVRKAGVETSVDNSFRNVVTALAHTLRYTFDRHAGAGQRQEEQCDATTGLAPMRNHACIASAGQRRLQDRADALRSMAMDFFQHQAAGTDGDRFRCKGGDCGSDEVRIHEGRTIGIGWKEFEREGGLASAIGSGKDQDSRWAGRSGDHDLFGLHA